MSKTLDVYSDFYFNTQLDFDKKLIFFRYKTIKAFFKGTVALEMGPAEGVMTEWLCNDFEELDIVDGSKILLDAVPNYPNVTKHQSWFEEFSPSRKYDTIIMEHVLEHIEHPVEVLLKVKEWLKKDGVLIIGVPNAKSIHRLAAVKMGLLQSEYQLNERDIALGHYRVYDMERFKGDVLGAGFLIQHSGGVFFKPVSNGQIQTEWTEQMIEGFYQLGKDFPEHTAEIFIVASHE